MSKWNKQSKPPTQQFLQNQQRRRQMIIQASKRRREKEKKLQQLNENLKKNEQQALQKHKKQKQEAYQKYLKSNNNMHDKYEQIKRNEKMQEESKKQVSKWKKRDNSAEVPRNGDLAQGQVEEGYSRKKELDKESKEEQVVKKGVQNKKAVQRQFQKQWGQQNEQLSQQLLGSKLLDSLDLDIDTMQRGRQLTDKLQKIKKMQDKPQIQKDEVEQIKNLIGYESMLVSYDNQTQQPSIKQTISAKNIASKPTTNANKNLKQKQDESKKQVNQQQTFNNLKNKKQAKILEWATNKVEQADDLFSNCSSSKNIAKNNLRDNSKESKGSKKQLEPIPEKRNKSVNKSVEKQRKSIQKSPNTPSIPPTQKIPTHVKNNSQNQIKSGKQIKQSDERKVISSKQKQQKSSQIEKRIPHINNQNRNQNRSVSKQKVKQNQAIFQKDKQKSLQKLRQRKFSVERTTSAEKPRNAPGAVPQIPKTQQPFRSQKPLPPIVPKQTYTVATHEQYFDVQSFIMNDLVLLNQQQRKLQEQIRNIHLQNKNKVKEIENKYEIKTNYKNSNSLIAKHQGKSYQQPKDQVETYGYGKVHAVQNQDLIQESIQRLDDFLIKRDITSREKTHISEQSNIKSIINPLSKPEDFQKQILQLAQNISKFQNQPEKDPKGYGYQHKMKKKPQKLQIPEQISVSRNVDEAVLQKQRQKEQKQQQERRKILKMPNPPILEYSSKNNQLVQVNMQQQYFDPEDSLETMKRQKVQVNQKLKNMLFDD